MNLSPFLYRRLARWLPLELSLGGGSRVRLRSKYDLASFQDVFCHPFYWQVYEWLREKPALVIDAGAHCGHFTLLADQCVRVRFPSACPQYILVEPNPLLIPILHRNLSDAGLAGRAEVLQACLGAKGGEATLWVDRRNFLSSGLLRGGEGARPVTVPFADLSQKVGNREVDVMKVDIEGGEFDLVASQADLFARVRLLFLELHGPPGPRHEELMRTLNGVGLKMVVGPIDAHGHQLMAFAR